MVSFAIAFFWLSFIFLVTGIILVLFLFLVYRLTGGKRSFLSWFKAMQF